MKRLTPLSLVLVAVVGAALGGAARSATGQDAVNATCPISSEPVDGKTFVEHDGRRVGLCCGGCRRQFTAWTADRKTAFIAAAIGAPAPQEKRATDGPSTRPAHGAIVGGAYTLATCPVSGQKLGSKGDPVVRVYDGREVRFCCAGCIGKFEADRATYIAAIDRRIIDEQKRIYPVERCVVSGEPLEEDGKDIAVDHVVGNRLVRLCCKGCVRAIGKDPRPALANLDVAIRAQQVEHYPLTTCVVSGEKLGSMGEPVEVIAGNRLVRFCCKGCVRAFEKNASEHVAAIDRAWVEKHRTLGTAPGRREHGHDHGHGHDHDHDH